MVAAERVIQDGEYQGGGDEQGQQTRQVTLVHTKEVALVEHFDVYALEAVRAEDPRQ